MPTIITRGAGSAQGLGYAAKSTDANFIEDVFSTYLYTGNGSTQTITTGVDTGTKGGLIWVKKRSAADDHALFDSVRASGSVLSSNLSDAATAGGSRLALTSTGFDLQSGGGTYNQNGFTYASWTFRKQPKFFDVVTYTGTGANRTIAHNLGSVPGAIWVKRTDAAANWQCYHRSLSNTQYMVLNSPDTVATNADRWNSTTPTSSVFSLGTNTTVNASGGTYVAYIFAHNAGGFGLSGTDNVISCGSYTGTGTTTGPFVNLGYEPQWIIVKRVGSQNWLMLDTMRYWTAGTGGGFSNGVVLQASGPDAEGGIAAYAFPTSTGFQVYDTQINTGGVDFIYIAIRRGPMKVPTSGTSVFEIDTRNATVPTFVSNFPVDMSTYRAKSGSDWYLQSRLTPNFLLTNSTAAESAGWVFNAAQFTSNTGWGVSPGSDNPDIFSYMFRRAPGFFDVVCYTGNGVNGRTVTHNLAAVPEIMIVKRRSAAGSWATYTSSTGNTKRLSLDTADAADVQSAFWNNTSPTSTVFTVGTFSDVNTNGSTYVAYLFATVAGVSKVGSYTGTGTTQTINCGFTAGARFVLIKRTDSTGDWYVWDSARGIVAGNDPYLLLNSTAAEVTSTDYVDTAASGFEISSTAPAAINANGGSFIFLAVS